MDFSFGKYNMTFGNAGGIVEINGERFDLRFTASSGDKNERDGTFSGFARGTELGYIAMITIQGKRETQQLITVFPRKDGTYLAT